jgi:hypothetical protein
MNKPREGEDLCFYISSSLETTSANNSYVTQIIAGPKPYQASSPAPKLQPMPVRVISPTGNQATDKTYYSNLDAEAKQFGAITAMINKLPMGKNG